MYTTRYVVRPATHRIAKMGAPCLARNISSFPAPFYPRWGFPTSDFNQVFRLLDESTRAFDSLFSGEAPAASRQVFSPRFDIREVDGAYELRGELPGVEASDVSVEFTDPKTLIISGRTEREASSGTPPQPIEAAATTTEQQQVKAKATEESDTASVHSSGSSYQKPTVEDDYVDAGEEASADAVARTESTVNATATEPQQQVAQTTEQAPKQPERPYWISERSVGSFSRTFNFPANVDQDGVTASLKNGILNIIVPKAKAPESRRIEIQ